MPITAVPYTAVYGPLAVSGATCQLWLDAADTTTLKLSGTSVLQWNDKSGYGQNATAVGSPVYSNLGVLLTRSSSQYFTLPNGAYPSGSNPYSFFMVFNLNSYSVAGFFGAGDYSTTWGTIAVRGNASQSIQLYWWGDSANLITSNTFTLNTPNLLCTTGTAYARALYLNAQTPVTDTQTGPRNQLTTGNTIGRAYPGDGTLDGYISEFIVFSSVLSTPQRQQVEGYLAQKWGFTSSLPAGHPGLTQTLYNGRVYQSRIPLAPPPVNPYFNPTLIAGCQLWLDGTDPLGNGSVPANGTVISSWKDKSGKNVTTTGVNNPTYSSSAKGISFTNSSSQYYSLPNGTFPYGDSSYSYFIICNWNGNSGPYGLVGAGILAADQLWVIRNNANTVANYWYADDITTSTTMTPGQTTYISAFYSSGKGLRSVWINFYSGVSGNPANNRNQPNTNCTVGAAVVSQSEYMNGTISEVIVFNTNLIGTQQYIIEGYLAWKWGLQSSLPSNHPYLNVPPGVPWESSLTKIVTTIPYIIATGGTVTFAFGREFHTFTSNGTFTISTNTKSRLIDILCVGGGGGGGGFEGGGGGGGGFTLLTTNLAFGSYTITLGNGGTAGVQSGAAGGVGGTTTFGVLVTAAGGGGGGSSFGTGPSNGASGGGGAYNQSYGTGSPGGNGAVADPGLAWGGGGGGASGAATNNNGGPGTAYYGAYYAGGGGGGGNQGSPGTGGIGGGGAGGGSNITALPVPTPGTPNTGGGGGGMGYNLGGSIGGSGVCIVSFSTT